jgi:arsenate reductase
MPNILKIIDSSRTTRMAAMLAPVLAPALACLLGCTPASQAGPVAPEPSPTQQPQPESRAVSLQPSLHAYVETLLPTLETIPAERRETLEQIATFVRERRAAGQPVRLVFICTHNSRRSHMSQIWAATAAAWYGIAGVETYSGGTEATAFNPRAVAAMRRAGFAIPEVPADASNPHYAVAFATEGPALDVFSKTFDAEGNPDDEFAAIMNCSEADKACPFVPGAALRISLAYDDPKVADGTPEEAARYDERAQQIGREMFYLFSRVEG